MNIKLFNKESSITTSPVYFAYLILKYIKKKKTVSIFEIVDILKKSDPNAHISQVLYGLMFLFLCDIITFDAPYVRIKNAFTQETLF